MEKNPKKEHEVSHLVSVLFVVSFFIVIGALIFYEMYFAKG